MIASKDPRKRKLIIDIDFSLGGFAFDLKSRS